VTAWLFLAAVAVRLAALAALGAHPQTYEYEAQARSLLAGEGYRLRYLGTPHLAFGPPLFGFLCAGLYRVFGPGPLPVLLLQIVISASIPVVVARLARAIGLDRRQQWLAGVPAVVHPGLVVYAVAKLHPLSLDALLLSATLLAVMRVPAAPGWGGPIGAGLVLGTTILTRATVAAFAIPAAAWIAWVTRARRRALPAVAVVAGTAALVVAPWTVRNYVVFHRLVFVTTDTAELFWRGNNPVATGSALLPNGRPVLSGAPEAFREAVLARDELGQVDLFRETARAYVREHPGRVLALMARKWLSFWWFPATAGLTYPARWLALYRLFYAVELAAACAGAVMLWRGADGAARLRLVLVLALLATVSAAQSLFYVDVRHRWGVEPLLGLFVAGAAGAAWARAVRGGAA
jgi:hypothetical protein